MTVDDVTRLFAMFAAEYDKFDFNKEKVIIWSTMLADVPWDVGKIAAMLLINKSPYPPKLSDLTNKIAEVITPTNEKLTATEAWQEVKRAIHAVGYKQYDPNPEEQFLSVLSPLTRKVVASIGVREVCGYSLDTEGVTRGQFIKMYEAQKQREHDRKQIPQALNNTIEKLASSMNLKALKAGGANEE